MKVTKAKSAENRRALVRAASKLFRRSGIDGVGVADIAKEAGLTHGALYAQFPSKEALAAEALADGLTRSYQRMTESAEGEIDLTHLLDFFINERHRDDIARGCGMSASGSEIARQGRAVSKSFTEGFDRIAREFERVLKSSPLSASVRERALAIATGEIGAIIVARAIAKADAKLSREVLKATRRVLGEIGGERPQRLAP